MNLDDCKHGFIARTCHVCAKYKLLVWADGRWITALKGATHAEALEGSLEFTRFKIVAQITYQKGD